MMGADWFGKHNGIAGLDGRLRIWAHLLVVVLLGGLIYSNTLQVPFVFDDQSYVEKNPVLKDWRGFIDGDYAERLIADGSLNQNFRSRILTFFTFAINHILFGNSLAGYHLVNLVIHLANGLLVYWLTVLTSRTPFAERVGWRKQGVMPLLAALLFVTHPVQTEAVTYVCQRFASLATFFYLLSLNFYILWRLSTVTSGDFRSKLSVRQFFGKSSLYYIISLLATIAAMKSKEIAFTLPLMLCLYEYCFLADGQRRNWLFLVPFLLTMAIIPLTVLSERAEYGDIIAFQSSWHVAGTPKALSYFYTQLTVVVTYLRILLLPINQNLDYSYVPFSGFLQLPVMLSFIALCLLVWIGGRFFVRSERTLVPQAFAERLVAFGIFWFFLALSVESSFFPLDDLIAERRLYLPSVGFCLVLVGLSDILRIRLSRPAGKIMAAGMLLLVLVWSGATYARNAVWSDPLALFGDVVQKSPDKPRAHFNLGVVSRRLGRYDEAIREFNEVVRLDPSRVDAYCNMAGVYAARGDYATALKLYLQAGKYPASLVYPKFYNVLGDLFQKEGHLAEAEIALRRAVQRDKHPEDSMRELGRVLYRQNKVAEAEAMFEAAAQLDQKGG